MEPSRTGPRGPGFLLADWLFFHRPAEEPRPRWWRATRAAAVSGLAALGLALALEPPELQGHDLHRNLSLDIAFNRAVCGSRSRVSPAFSLSQHLEARAELAETPLREVVTRAMGPPEAYCASVTEPVLNNENSLMLEMSLFLSAAPNISLKQLGWALQATRVLALLVLAVVLLESGASLLFAAASLGVGLVILAHLDFKCYSVYPSAPALLALIVGVLSAAFLRAPSRRLVGEMVVTAVAGWLGAFAANMRTSHLPVYAVLLVLYFAATQSRLHAAPQRRPLRDRLSLVAGGVLSLTATYAAFGWLMVRPLASEAGSGPSYSYHVIAHPLVLGLAVPESALSRREGIAWDDSVGITLARRVDPEVTYLRAGYEAALMRYYIGLWQRHPHEMLGIYHTKLRVAGRDMIDSLLRGPSSPAGSELVRAVLLPLVWVPSGVWLLVVYLGILAVALACSLRSGHLVAFTIALVAAAALLLHLEAALIYPLFERSHHSASLLCFLLLVGMAWQLVLEGVRRAITGGFAHRRKLRTARQP